MNEIKYQMEQNGILLDVSIGYNEINLETAKSEAYKGVYTIYDEDGKVVS
jgi:hypothetical protein